MSKKQLNYLSAVDQTSNIDIEDIAKYSRLICEDIINTALQSSDYTKESVVENLKKANMTEIETYVFNDGSCQISCVLNYIPNENYALQVPFSQHLIFCVEKDENIHCGYGVCAVALCDEHEEKIWCDLD